MATVLCVWELGGNLGHLSNLLLPIEVALAQGHKVVLAARQLHHAASVFGDLPITYLQAPCKQEFVLADQSAFPSYTHLLARQCFSSVDELQMLVRAWRSIFDLVKPELVLFEHSPTALIAAWGQPFKKVVLGNGFTLPPLQPDPSAPFVPFPTTALAPQVKQGLQHDDGEVLKLINLALQKTGGPALPHLHAMFSQADARLLMTWPALDPYGERPDERYLGVEAPQKRESPSWPQGAGHKVFGYLQAFPSLEFLLRDLLAAGVAALLFVRNLPPALREKYGGVNIRFLDRPVDLNSIAMEAKWVITHGNHSTTAQFMQAGVPQLIIPPHQEQLFTAMRMAQAGAAIVAYQDQPGFQKEIAQLLTEPALKLKALGLQARHKNNSNALSAPAVIRDTFKSLLTMAM